MQAVTKELLWGGSSGKVRYGRAADDHRAMRVTGAPLREC